MPDLPARFATTAPDAPGRLPLIGNAFQVLLNPKRFLEAMRPKKPVLRVRVGPFEFYLVNDPALIRQINLDSDVFHRGRLFDVVDRSLAASRFHCEGAAHRSVRKKLTPTFGQKGIREFAPAITRHARAHTDRWQDGSVLDIGREMEELAIGCTLDFLFGTPVTGDELAALRHALTILPRRFALETALPAWLTALPVPANRRFAATMADLTTLLDKLIDDQRRAPEPRGALAALITGSDHDRPREDVIRADILVILLAGIGTVAGTLAWAIIELARHPAASEQLDRELGAATAQEDPDLRALPCTRRMIEETLRLHSVTFLTQRASTAVTLGEVAIPAGAELVFSPNALHRDPTLHPGAGRFDPGRLGSTREHARAGSYLPFGIGAHRCPGEHLALTETVLMLATVQSRWNLRPVPGQALPHSDRVNAQPHGFLMTAEKRR
ncbi:cytochrome P450 [Amycolatopsis minnesotensis]|uniref:Cytochrome P450 n=1 Tax=Amycolatopsis minnesotensis TaxID=337894 RepID=A0ABP5C787_9PSEU